MSQEIQICSSCKNEFQIGANETERWQKFDLPLPTQCPDCIWKNMLSFWVFGKFRKLTSPLSGKTIITTLPEDAKYPIYSYHEWMSDEWDPLSYGQDYDSDRPFFDQFKELQNKVPHPHSSGTNSTNCDWCDDVWSCKDCYLCRSLMGCENVSYGYRVLNCRNSVDVVFSFDAELSYDCVNCNKCYKVQHAFDARNAMNSAFLYDCRNVQNCFMCWNLRDKQYCIKNQQYSKEEYERRIAALDLASRSGRESLKKEFRELIRKESIHRENLNFNSVSSTGNSMDETRNCEDCYQLQKSENCIRVIRGYEDKDVLYGTGTMAESSALSMMDGYNHNTIATCRSTRCRDSAYLDYCEECSNCLACVGLRKKQYCIFNKQYAPEEYKEMRAIIENNMRKAGEWGKFFPPGLAYGGYNYSVAQFYYPLSESEASRYGFKWEKIEGASDGLAGDQVPETSAEVSAEFCKQPIICSQSGMRFNIAPSELDFYQKEGLPLPNRHPDERTREGYGMMTVCSPIQGSCYSCKKAILHFYPRDWGYEKIACIDCYQKQVI